MKNQRPILVLRKGHAGEGTRGQARPHVERLRWIAGMLRFGEAFNASHVAKKFEIHPKTAHRDLEFLRDRLGYEFEFDAYKNGYVLIHAPEPEL